MSQNSVYTEACEMSEYFIKNVRNIGELAISLDDEERKHLIFTGKNGSGKTSTLRETNNFLNRLLANQFAQIENLKKNILQYKEHIKKIQNNIENFNKQLQQQEEHKKKLLDDNAIPQQIQQIEQNIRSYNSNILTHNNNIETYKQQIVTWEKQISDFANIEMSFSNENTIYEKILNGDFILAFFEAKRQTQVAMPQTVTKQVFQVKYPTTPNLSQTFVQYMVNIKTEKMFAQDEGDTEAAEKIDEWFHNFENALKTLFDEEDLKLTFYRKEFNFKIEFADKSFGLNELSDGYSSILSILTELILRMEAKETKSYDVQGIVLIDEIETHLHVDLQKKILPFLTSFFPKIQFIVTTHSPFVLSSLSNTVICDLEKKFTTEDLTGYSYESLVDSYFDTDKYSQDVKIKLQRFEELTVESIKQPLEDEQLREFLKLENFFDTLPKYQNEDIGFQVNRIKQLQLSEK